MPVTIGILNADELRPELKEVYGDYFKIFTQLLVDADPSVKTVHYNVLEGHYPDNIDEVDGYLITGSKFSVYDDEAWIRRLGDFIVALNERRKKLVGVCFGHQMVAHYLGGETRRSEGGWNLGVHKLNMIEDVPGFAIAGDVFNLIASHQDQVVTLAPTAKLLATSMVCPNVMTSIGNHIITVQWHPEFSKSFADSLFDVRREAIGEQAFQNAKSSLKNSIDNEKFARLAIDFIQDKNQL